MGTNDLLDLKVGTIIKAKGEDHRYHRVEVLEVAGGELPVKVRWSRKQKSGKKQDSWLKRADFRLSRHITVDWDDFHSKLPTGQDPTSRALRKQIFASWDTGRKRCLTLEQLQSGVVTLLGDEFGEDLEEVAPAVKGAWKAARNLVPARKRQMKLAAKSVDSREFHAFIVALGYYIQLAELFEHLDAFQEDDQKLSCRECRRGLVNLEEWGISEGKLADKFKGHDPWTPLITFEDFANWCVEERWSHLNLNTELDSSDDEVQLELGAEELRQAAGISPQDRRLGSKTAENMQKVTNAFQAADMNQSGTICEEELISVFTKLNAKISPEAVRHLFALADSNKDGQVDYEEFCRWLFR